MPYENIFVTVGTTQFNALINALSTEQMYKTLLNMGCRKLTIQTGTGDVPSDIYDIYREGITLNTYETKSSIAKDIEEADLVISHAGAGSCMEILHEGKPLLVVVNDELADNHQLELAEKLCELKELFYCSPRRLHEALLNFDESLISERKRPFPIKPLKFIDELDSLMGFVPWRDPGTEL